MKRLPSSPEQIEAAFASSPTFDLVPWRVVHTIDPTLPQTDWRSTTPAHVLIAAMVAERVENRDLITRLHADVRAARAESLRLREAARTLCAAVDLERLFEVTP
jgi:hypothetical protein